MKATPEDVWALRASLVRWLHGARGLSLPDAEDAAGEACLRAVRYLGQFNGRCQLRSWVWQIASNLALNEAQRGPGRRKPEIVGLDTDTGEEWLADPAAGPEREAQARDLLRAVEQYRGFTPYELRAVVTVARGERVNNSAKTGLFRARRKLARLLEA